MTTKRALLESRIASLGHIDQRMWEQLKSELAPITDGYLRKLLRASGKPLLPWVEGVNTATLDSAERTLRALAEAYELAEAPERKHLRAVVLESKQHLRWRMQRPDPPPEKQEILLWLSIWLENPALFPQWISLRRALK